MMKQMLSNSYLFGTNTPYVEELYEKYLDNPGSIDPNWRDYFDKLVNLPGAGAYLGPYVPHARSPNAPRKVPCASHNDRAVLPRPRSKPRSCS